MKISYYEDPKMNHYEIKLVTHPKNVRLAKLLANQFTEKLGEIEVYDDCRNIYPLPILSIYYFEIIDHKIFAYTQKDVYRLRCMTMAKLHEEMKEFGFYQINVRTLVNIKYVGQYKKQIGCRRRLVLDNGDILISSRRYHEEFDRMIEDQKLINLTKKRLEE